MRIILDTEVIDAPDLPSPVCGDPDDDNFIACALVGGVPVIVSGDKDLLAVDGCRCVSILRSRALLDRLPL